VRNYGECTSNIVESLNSLSIDGRTNGTPLEVLLAAIQRTSNMQSKVLESLNEVDRKFAASENPNCRILTGLGLKLWNKNVVHSSNYTAARVGKTNIVNLTYNNGSECIETGDAARSTNTVDFDQGVCTCKQFQTTTQPCVHAIAGAHVLGLSHTALQDLFCYEFLVKKESWIK
jgi:hypothetical protein